MLCSHLAPLVRINDLSDKRYERLLVVAHSIEYIEHLQVFVRVHTQGAFNLASQPYLGKPIKDVEIQNLEKPCKLI